MKMLTRRNFLKTAVIGGTGLAAIGLVGCSSSSSSSESTSESSETVNSEDTAEEEAVAVDTSDGSVVVTVGISSDFSDMSPFGGQSGGKQYYKWLIYGYLALTDKDNVYHGTLAKSYTYVDNTTLDVEIYDYITDFEGNEITADDVIYCFQSAKDGGNFAGQGPMYVDKMEKLDDYTVRFYFTQDTLGGCISYISNVPIISQKAYEESEDSMAVNIIGTGRYKIVDFVSGSTMTLDKVENYWQSDDLYDLDQLAANADEIIYKYIPEAAQMSIALETGLIDVAGSMSGTDAERFLDDNNEAVDGYNVEIIEPTQFTCVLFNCTEGSLFDNQALRQAVCYALDTDGIVTAVLGGKGKACSTFGPSTLIDFNTDWLTEDYYDYNLDLAKEKMEEAGYPDGGLTIRLVVDSNSLRGKLAEVIQASLEQIGITVEISAYETALFNTYKNEQDEWEILIDTKNGSSYMPNAWRSNFDNTATGTGMTINFAKDDTLQELYKAAANPETHSDETVNDFHEYLKEQAYAYGIYVAYEYVIGLDTIEELFVNSSNYPCPGAFVYSDSFVGVSQ